MSPECRNILPVKHSFARPALRSPHSALLILAFVLASRLSAQTEIMSWITATPGVPSLVMAVAEFTRSDRNNPELVQSGSAIRTVMMKDLTNSLFFQLRKPDSNKVFSSGASMIDFTNWANTGATVLVAADISPSTLTLRMYDLLSRRLLVSKDYTRSGTDRVLGHRVADEIIKFLTGEEGVSTSRIVFSRRRSPDRELCTVDQDGLGLQQLTTGGGMKLSPDWSPDGSRIAFSAYHNDKLVLFAYNTADATIATVCDQAEMNDTPSWSPDGSRLAASLSTGPGQEIYVMDANGRNLRQVTHNAAVSISPTWSPNGQQIAFVSDRAGSPQVYVVNADGTDQRRLTFEGNYNTSPAWSSRGDVIAYSRRENNINQIFITDIEGLVHQQLTFSGNNVEPCFSPDGLHIAYISNRDGSDDIYVMNWNGTDQHRLTTIGGCSAPSWSPPLH